MVIEMYGMVAGGIGGRGGECLSWRAAQGVSRREVSAGGGCRRTSGMEVIASIDREAAHDNGRVDLLHSNHIDQLQRAAPLFAILLLLQ